MEARLEERHPVQDLQHHEGHGDGQEELAEGHRDPDGAGEEDGGGGGEALDPVAPVAEDDVARRQEADDQW